MARDRGVPGPALQMLYYPATTGSEPVPSRRHFANGFMLTAGMMNWFKALYVQDAAHEQSPYYAPASARNFRDLPPAVIVTAEFDPLRDEGRLYAERLESAGVQVRYRCVPGTIHGFLIFFPFMPKAWRVLRQTGREIRKALDG
jgi:acetyl esterase